MSTEKWYGQTDKDVWQTPSWLYEGIEESLVDGIDLDPCSGEETNIADVNWSIIDDENGLKKDWFGTVFVNPPFSDKEMWIEKSINEMTNTDCIFLVTPDSTDVQSWWHSKVVPHASYVWFSEGRIKYINPQTQTEAKSPTFGTSVSVFGDVDVVSDGSLLTWLQEHGWLVNNK